MGNVLRVAKVSADDIRLNMKLYKACATDWKKFCKDVEPGHMRVQVHALEVSDSIYVHAHGGLGWLLCPTGGLALPCSLLVMLANPASQSRGEGRTYDIPSWHVRMLRALSVRPLLCFVRQALLFFCGRLEDDGDSTYLIQKPFWGGFAGTLGQSGCTLRGRCLLLGFMRRIIWSGEYRSAVKVIHL
jgi:hypothetical protein